MRSFILLVLILILMENNPASAQKLQPEDFAKGQLDAYNKQDLEAFLNWFSDSVEIYDFPNTLLYKGKEEMRKRYASAWKQNPGQKGNLMGRMSVGNTVMDKEHVTGRANGIEVNVIAIYTIENDKIQQVHFVRE